MAKKPEDLSKRSNVKITKKDLHDLLTDMLNMKKEVSSATGSLRNVLKQHLEKTGLHNKAVAIVRQLDEMPESSRQMVLMSLMPSLEILINGRWKPKQGNFLDESKPKEEGKD